MAAPVQNNLHGIATMLLGIGLFAGGDAVGKLMAGTYPAAEILLLRSIPPLLLLLPLLPVASLSRGGGWPRPARVGWHVLRAGLSTLEVACFFAAVARLPLADALTFYLAGPVYVTALSAPLLGERVGRARWGAVLAGFAGVVVALDPGTSGGPGNGASLVALCGSLAYAGSLVVTRALRESTEPVLTAWQFAGTLLFGAVAFGAGFVPGGWLVPSGRDLVLLCGGGVVSMLGNLCVTRALRLAGASVVVPYQYTIIVWAVLNGWLVFGDVPHAATLAGAGMVVGAGLFIAAREARSGVT